MIGIAILANSACSNPRHSGTPLKPIPTSAGTGVAYSPAIIRGKVADNTSGAPIVGALVEWSYGARKLLGSTDAKGAYAFAVPVPKDGDNSRDFTISVSTWSNIHEAATQMVRIRSGEVTALNFSLGVKPLAKIGLVHGRVTDTMTGQAVSGIVVSITGSGGDLTTTTLHDGTYNFPQIGLGRVIVVRAFAREPPCFVAAERTFNMVRLVATQDFPLNRVLTQSLRCPTDVEVLPKSH
jgi:hypothetical protein